jgi:hypothetical protein
MARHSRVYSSITVRQFGCCPLAKPTNTKSYAQTRFSAAAENRRGVLEAVSSALAGPQTTRSGTPDRAGAHRPTSTLQKDLVVAIAEAATRPETSPLSGLDHCRYPLILTKHREREKVNSARTRRTDHPRLHA